MSSDVILVNGVTLQPPESLSPDEVSDLARFNAERRAGYLYDAGTLDRMARMQLRFDWLGYYTDDGGHHAGRLASARIIVLRGERQPWWRFGRRVSLR